MPRRLIYTALTWLALASPLQAATYTPDDDRLGALTYYKVQKNDHLSFIARKLDVGIVELMAANPGLTQKNLKAGATLVVPTSYILPDTQEGIVLNLAALRLFYFAPDGSVMTFPVGIGREGWQTPTGEATVILKRKDPTWIPPDSIREEDPKLPAIVPPGPDNPLGAYAMNLSLPGIRIHGTNHPYSIGKRASHGCIRLYPEDIEALFNAVEPGTPVSIIDSAYTLGWQEDTLLLQVGPTQEQDDDIAAYRKAEPVNLPALHDAIVAMAGDHTEINWAAVDKAVAVHNLTPVAISTRTQEDEDEGD